MCMHVVKEEEDEGEGAVRRLCEYCKVVKRRNRVFVLCSVNPKHKQRQGFCDIAYDSTLPSIMEEFTVVGKWFSPNLHHAPSELKSLTSQFRSACPGPATPLGFERRLPELYSPKLSDAVVSRFQPAELNESVGLASILPATVAHTKTTSS